jgi:hypothetical protein
MSGNGLSLFRSCLKITLKARFTHLPTKFPEEPVRLIGAYGWILTNSELRQIDSKNLAGKYNSARYVIDANIQQICSQGINDFDKSII